MAYQATDFEGLAWAQYDRAFRRQMAQTKDLHRSHLNPTLYRLCFAGKAKCHIACSFCLSNNHSAESCLENPVGSLFPANAGGQTPVSRPLSKPATNQGTQDTRSPVMLVMALVASSNHANLLTCVYNAGGHTLNQPGRENNTGFNTKHPRLE